MKRFMLVSAMLITALFVVVGSACDSSSAASGMPGTPVEVDGGTYWRLTPNQFDIFISGDVFLVVVDEAYSGEITGTDQWIKASEIADNINLFPTDKDANVAVYCATATRTPAVATALVQAGYTHVAELGGGWTAWIQQGYSPPRTNTARFE
ncbi:MAG: rhodanese-like domain-containing protein [Dehalococcoidia bacterium]|nr:rhodanese-like domain-containing protein [Dehalococcoidia bacterium]